MSSTSRGVRIPESPGTWSTDCVDVSTNDEVKDAGSRHSEGILEARSLHFEAARSCQDGFGTGAAAIAEVH